MTIVDNVSALSLPKGQSLEVRFRPLRIAVASLALVLGLSTGVQAADLPAPSVQIAEPPPVVDQGVVFTASLYGWGIGVSGRARTLPPLPAVSFNIPFDKVLSDLKGAIMGAAEVKIGSFFLLNDLLAAKLGGGKEFAVPRTFGLGVKVETTIVTDLVAAGYRIYDDQRFSVDGFAGVRGFYVDSILKLDPGVGPSISFGKSETWADPAAGGRVLYHLNQDWFVSAIGSVGGVNTRSNYYWDAYTGVGYAFNERYSAFMGFRIMKIDYKHGNFLYNVELKGPVAGLNIHF